MSRVTVVLLFICCFSDAGFAKSALASRKPSQLPPPPPTTPTSVSVPAAPLVVPLAAPALSRVEGAAPRKASRLTLANDKESRKKALQNGTHLRTYNPYRDIELQLRAEWDPEILENMRSKIADDEYRKKAAKDYRKEREHDKQESERARKEFTLWQAKNPEVIDEKLEYLYNVEQQKQQEEYKKIQVKAAQERRAATRQMIQNRRALVQRYFAERSAYFEKQRLDMLERAPAMIKMPVIVPTNKK